MNLGKDDKYALAHMAVDGLLVQNLLDFEHVNFDGKDWIKVRILLWGLKFNIATINVQMDPQNPS